MKTIEINGKLLPIIYNFIEYYADCEYSGTEIVITSYDGNLIKCTRTFEIVDQDENGDYIYSRSKWEIEKLCTLVELL